ncbi:MAG TPA: PTS sugar transporter subunit IIA [Pirellulaceae bacterium]|nr:PTS sugar transporter subunit IIA [Pirellulaceae bacterium]
MPDGDFDIPSLAQYLHLAADVVLRMAERGKLPGRKMQGQWKFSSAEIHHWLEERIGASEDDAELAQVEGVLDRGRASEQTADESISITGLLPIAAIAKPLAARTRGAVIKDMVDLAAQTGWLWDPEKLAEAVRARESLHPTALDNGVALLHPRRPMANILAEPFLALGITSSGVPFGDAKGQLTDIFFLICATSDREHLRMLARLSRLIGDESFLSELRAADDARAVHELIEQREQDLSP